MKVRLTNPSYIKESVVDGLGVRLFIGFQGCSIGCRGCHNPQAHCHNSGIEADIEDVFNTINQEAKYHDGVTFSGGNPIEQPEALKVIAEYCHSLGLDTWLYSGYTFEQLIQDAAAVDALSHIDVLVDGPYIEELRDLSLPFRGSSNQRIINVKLSLAKGKAVLYME